MSSKADKPVGTKASIDEKVGTRLWPLVLFLLALAGAGWLTTYFDAVCGLVLYVLVLFGLLAAASLRAEHPDHRFYLSMALVPLIAIVSLSMPLEYFLELYRYLLISVPVLAAALVVIRILRLSPAEIGLSFSRVLQVPLQGLIGLTGAIFGLIGFWLLSPQPLIPTLSLEKVLPPALIFLVATGFTEELVFRGIIQRSSLEVMGTWGLVYTAAVFSTFYVGYLSWISWAWWGVVFVAGFFFGWITKQTGSIWGVSLADGLVNICLYLILPLLPLGFIPKLI
ncbi:MAG: CPBP family intramembrane metalloprotease [Chloroflexi bacterium]|nr:MAG: CPBP family intramembrane metalloprotease [Chloroflexota bacterium]